MQNINWVDGIVYVIILLSVFRGMMRGLFSSLLGITALTLAFILARARPPLLVSFMQSQLGVPPLSAALTSALIFVAALLAFGFAARLLNAALVKIDLGGLNGAGGAVFGFVRGGLFSLLFILILSVAGAQHWRSWEESYTVPHLGRALRWIINLPPLASYKDWLAFDEHNRPLLSGAAAAEKIPLPPDAPAIVNPPQEEQTEQPPAAAEELAAEELITRETRGSLKAQEKTLQELLVALQPPNAAANTPQKEKQARAATPADSPQQTIEDLTKLLVLRQYVACELKGGKNCQPQ